MKWLIDTDSPFYNLMNFFADIIIFGFLFFICSLPIFTIGTANCAIYYVVKKRIADEKATIKDFFIAFKKNFLPSTLIWIVMVILITLIIYLSYINIYLFLPISIFCILEIMFTFTYFFPITTKNKFSTKKSIKLSLILAHKHLATTFLCTLILIITVITCFFYLPLFLISGGVYNFLTCNLIEKIFSKYNL